MSDLYETGFAIPIESKADESGEFTGYASTFGNIDSGADIMMPGAFAKTISKRGASGVKMLWNHDRDQPIGVWTEMSEDKRGLKVKGKLLLSVQKAREVYELMKAGVIDSLSVGFRTVKSTYDTNTGIRQILDVDLWEISAVTFPMNPKATIQGVKTMPTRKELEAALRNEAGLSNADARKAAAITRRLLRNGEDEPADQLRKEARVSALSDALDEILGAIRK